MEARREDALQTGHEGIDAEHEVLLRLLDAIIDAVGRGAGMSDLEALLQQVADYTNVHFLSEQLLMRRYAYPGYEGHVQEHDRLIRELKAIVEASRFGQVAPDRVLLSALRRWLVTHVLEMDRPLGAFLTEASRPRP